VVLLVKGKVSSARAKNNENQREYDDVMDVMVGLTGEEVNTSKRGISGRSMENCEDIGLVVVIGKGKVQSARAKNSEN
jgi:hypothetical protein